MALPLGLGAIRGLLKDIEASSRDDRPLAVGGPRELAAVLRRELLAGATDLDAVRVGDPAGAVLYVHVISGSEPDADDEAALKRARRERVPIVAVVAGPASDDLTLPFVLATDVVRVGAGEGFPLDRIAETIAARLGEGGAPLAARVPLLRRAVCDEIVATFARKNGIIGVAVFIPGADLPLLTLNQLRLVLRIAQAYGEDVGRERVPELVATFGLGIGLRAAARELLDVVPVAGWAVKGAVAYAGTRALGEAAVRRFELGMPDPHGASPTPPPA